VRHRDNSFFESMQGAKITCLFRSQVLDADGKAPPNLPENYGALIVPSCGFAQVKLKPCSISIADVVVILFSSVLR
jgi:hypothetical protein